MVQIKILTSVRKDVGRDQVLFFWAKWEVLGNIPTFLRKRSTFYVQGKIWSIFVKVFSKEDKLKSTVGQV